MIFLGPQGSGKSTQAKLLAHNLDLVYLEMGQLLRDRAAQSDKLANELKQTLDAGHLVDNQITINILKNRIGNLNTNGYVLDGFPRNQAQYDALDKDIDIVFYVKVSDKEAIKRLTQRGRSDDTPRALKKRLGIYHDQTEPLLEKFKNRGILRQINGERPIEQINKDILQIADKF